MCSAKRRRAPVHPTQCRSPVPVHCPSKGRSLVSANDTLGNAHFQDQPSQLCGKRQARLKQSRAVPARAKIFASLPLWRNAKYRRIRPLCEDARWSVVRGCLGRLPGRSAKKRTAKKTVTCGLYCGDNATHGSGIIRGLAFSAPAALL